MVHKELRAGTADPASALTAEIADTARLLFSAGSVQNTLSRIVEVATATVEGCDWAGILVVVDGQVTTPARTEPLVTDLEDLQRQLDQGPCVDALHRGTVTYAGDFALHNTRWPRLGPQAVASGVRSLLALPLIDDRTRGALNLYARYPDAFGVLDRARGLLLATVATMALSAAHSQEVAEHQAASLHMALANREMIGQAQGILMERERITADEAFDVLRRASQHLNIKLRDVARTLVETGERPDTGDASGVPNPSAR